MSGRAEEYREMMKRMRGKWPPGSEGEYWDRKEERGPVMTKYTFEVGDVVELAGDNEGVSLTVIGLDESGSTATVAWFDHDLAFHYVAIASAALLPIPPEDQ
jgi:hypothetical protein